MCMGFVVMDFAVGQGVSTNLAPHSRASMLGLCYSYCFPEETLDLASNTIPVGTVDGHFTYIFQ